MFQKVGLCVARNIFNFPILNNTLAFKQLCAVYCNTTHHNPVLLSGCISLDTLGNGCFRTAVMPYWSRFPMHEGKSCQI